MVVAFDELQNSPKFAGSGGELSATRMGHIAGDHATLTSFYQELFPPPVLGIPRLPALMPNSSVLYANTFSADPWFEEAVPADVGPPASYLKWLVTIGYKSIPYSQSDPASGQIITRKWSVGGQFLTYKNVGLQWANADGSFTAIKDPEHHAGRLVPTRDLTVTLHRITQSYYESLQTTLDDLVGKVNNATWENSAAETVLLLGGEFEQNVTSDGSQSWQAELKFSKRIIHQGASQVGWNYAFREDNPGGAAWVRIQTKKPGAAVAGDPIYPLGDFSALYS